MGRAFPVIPWQIGHLVITLVLLVGAGTASSQADPRCIGCHDLGPDSPAHRLMEGSHGGDAGGTANPRYCESCHGPSDNHAQAPTQVSPDTSYGPRWTASSAAQDGSCLACHEENTAVHWRHALHMLNNVTCVTCHDVHAGGDKVLFPEQQADVCTICHKAQKQGIHGMEEAAALDPPCADCHNPHDHESAESRMLENQSIGCSGCHDQVDIAGSEKARRYHRVMSQPDRTCVECHQGIAHAPASSATAFAATPVTSKEVTLFYPGQAHSEWLLQQHPGSQPLRQGASCRQCHRGEEARMGLIQAGGFEPAHRNVQVSFARDEDSIRMILEWRGERDETDIALMWGTPQSGAPFNRGGCFAACHSDLPGMSRDRGQQMDKYLPASRLQQRSPGSPSAVRDKEELAQMLAAGQFAVLWRVRLNSGIAEAATLLDGHRVVAAGLATGRPDKGLHQLPEWTMGRENASGPESYARTTGEI